MCPIGFLYVWLDCSIIASRLQFNLDDLLWVLTDSQLKAALTFLNSLHDIITLASQQAKKLATDKLKVQQNVLFHFSPVLYPPHIH